jgi:GNAT superfamily N-acetyltransferase
LDYSIRKLTERNESNFCSLWTERIRVQNCADIFVNNKFVGDYFFNKVNIISSCHNINAIIKEAIKIFSRKNLDCFFYIGKGKVGDTIKAMLLQMRFSHIDTMQIFGIHLEDLLCEESNAHEIINVDSATLSSLWIDVFCESFNIPNWKPEVKRIVNLHYKDFNLIISVTEKNGKYVPAGCASLFRTNKVMGLYCLGTLPHLRRKGLAKKTIKTATCIAKENRSKLFFVQAFVNDGFEHIYQSLGFELLYQKEVYALYYKNLAKTINLDLQLMLS